MTPFCKLFNTKDFGQILVKISEDDEAGDPEVRFYAQPDGLGVCSLAAKYAGDDEGWERADTFFAQVDAAKAIEFAQPIFLLAAKETK